MRDVRGTCHLKDGGPEQCDEIEGGGLAFCSDRSEDGLRCSFWIRVEEGDLCCDSCVICPPGSTNDIGYNCDSRSPDMTAPCVDVR